MKHSVALILPYFGTLPNYFPLWLKSAGYNPDFTFMIFSDCDFSGYNVPDNVQVHYLTFDGLKKLIAPHLDFPFVLNTPYKLCEYKPMYGLIFQDYIAGYDFWGFCDSDIVWGDMSKFITDDLLEKYGRLYRAGHLQLYRNTKEVRYFALHKLPYWNISYRDIFRTEANMAYDESNLTEHVFAMFSGGEKQFDRADFANVLPQFHQFRLCVYEKICETVPAFRWKDGKLYGISVSGSVGGVNVEYLYVHLQKRAMRFTPSIENEDSFMIIPNEFVRDHVLSGEEIKMLMYSDSEYERLFAQKYSWKSDKKNMIERIKRDKEGMFAMLKYYVNYRRIRLKYRLNRLMGRSLSSMWKSRGIADSYNV